MSGLVVPQVVYGLTNEELAELVAKALKEIDWAFNGNISDQNISRIANFLASKTELKHISGIVGISGYDPGNPEAIRIWAGHADKTLAPFRVLQNGQIYATDAFLTGLITGSTIIGSEIMTALAGVYPRASMSSIDNLFTAEQSATIFIKMVADYFGAVALLINNANVSGVIEPLGNDLLITTFVGDGNIQISSGEDLLLNAAPGNSVKVEAWSAFVNRTTTQTLQQALDAKQDDITGGDITIIGGSATLNSGISATKIASGVVDNTEFQYLNGVTSAIQTQLDTKITSKSGKNVTDTGSVTITLTLANTQYNAVINFTSSFGTAPKVFVTVVDASNPTTYINVIPFSTTTSGSTVSCASGAAQTITFNWVAFGT